MNITDFDHRGFTLIEVLVAMAIFAILLCLAAPSFSDWSESARLKQSAREVMNAFQEARIEAIKHNTFVGLSFTTGSGAAGVVEVFIDDGAGGGTAGDCERTNGETVVTRFAMEKGVSLVDASFSTAGDKFTGFTSRGFAVSGQTGSVKVKNSEKTFTVSLAQAGAVSLN